MSGNPKEGPVPQVVIYTDGGCDPNPGPGGCGVVLSHPQKRSEASGGFRRTTNNRMEIYAAIKGLETKWSNVGVGKLYYGYALRCWLVNSAGRPVFAADTKADVRQWLPGEHLVVAALELPATLEPGEYDLALGGADPAGMRRPFLLAINAPEKDGRYPVGRVTIR